MPIALPEYIARPLPDREDIIASGILPKGAVMFLYGDEGTWKSWLIIDLVVSIGTRQNWLVYKTYPARILVINPELTDWEYQNRLKQFLRKNKIKQIPPDIFIHSDMDIKIDTLIGLGALTNYVREYQPDLVILDGLFAIMQGDISKNADAQRYISNINTARQHHPFACITVHHSKKATYDFNTGETVKLGTNQMFGSSFFRNWADTILEVAHDPDGFHEDVITITPQKYRTALVKPPAVQYYMDRKTLTFKFLEATNGNSANQRGP